MTSSWFKRRSGLLAKLIGASVAAGLAARFFYSTDNKETFAKRIESGQNEAAAAATDRKLIAVLLLTRHGARTPLYLISGLEQVEYKKELIEPYVKAKYKLKSIENEDFHDKLSAYDQRNFQQILKGGVGRGQLTSTGEKQMFDLGRRLRKRYLEDLKFLSSDYDPNEIYTRSSHYKRTINSAKSVLAGIYLNSHDDVPKEPFIINVEHLHDDILFPNTLACAYYSQARPFFERLKLLKHQEYMNNLNELKQILPASDSEYSFTAFRDDMLARQVHNLPVPKHLEPFLEISHRYGNMEITAQHDFNLKLSCGMLLNLLKQNLLSAVDNDTKKINQNYHKFRYYSAHDTTINSILVAFDLVNDENHEWPPFAANIIMELWKDCSNKATDDASKYIVRLYYCGELLSISGCDKDNKKECKLDEFIKVLERNTIEKHEFNKVCNQKFTP